MKRYKRIDGVNWQAMAIEDTQSRIKGFLMDAVESGRSVSDIRDGVRSIIADLLDSLDSEQIKAEAATSLPLFAERIYHMFLVIAAYRQDYAAKAGVTVEQAKDALAEGEPPLPPRHAYVLPDDIADPDDDPLTYNRNQQANDYFRDYQRKVRKALLDIIHLEAKPDYDARVNLRNIAEMTVRYEEQMRRLNNLSQKGVRLVWIEPHANCSERCAPWQGRLYSLDHTTGTTEDGERFEPLENAMNVETVTKRGKVYKNGCITGYNCRHKLSPYKPGQKPVEIPAAVIDKQRRIEAEQRAMERQLRVYKEAAYLHGGFELKRAADCRKKARELSAKYKAFCIKNEIPFVRERTRILSWEDIYLRHV